METIASAPDGAWPSALRILEKLRGAGFRALLAGGCVRDRILGQAPKDYDIATSATPEEVLKLYPQARRVGAAFGVILVRQAGYDIEVATFRSDGPYSDGRHPDQVTYGSETQDAQRRDFTINGLFLDPFTNEVIDYVGGQADLAAGVIRTIGAADQRFAEDHLRMLRAVRFAARFGFKVEAATLDAIQRWGSRLRQISAERIVTELKAILTPPTRGAGWGLLVETCLCDHLVEGWSPSERERIAIGARFAGLPTETQDFGLVLAVLLTAEPVRRALEIARLLRCSNREVRTVSWLLAALPAVRDGEELELAALKRLMADENWTLLPRFLTAGLHAAGSDRVLCDRLQERAAGIPKECITPPPLLNGDDLLAMGFPRGRDLGLILHAVYSAQLNETIATRTEAETLALTLRGNPV